MIPGDTKELVKTIGEAKGRTRGFGLLQGTVTAVSENELTVDFGLDPVPGIKYLGWYNAEVGDLVWAVENGADLLVIGPLFPLSKPARESHSHDHFSNDFQHTKVARDDDTPSQVGTGLSVTEGVVGGGFPTTGLLFTAMYENYGFQIIKGFISGDAYIRGGEYGTGGWETWMQMT